MVFDETCNRTISILMLEDFYPVLTPNLLSGSGVSDPVLSAETVFKFITSMLSSGGGDSASH